MNFRNKIESDFVLDTKKVLPGKDKTFLYGEHSLAMGF
jgi:hypothetical protein